MMIQPHTYTLTHCELLPSGTARKRTGTALPQNTTPTLTPTQPHTNTPEKDLECDAGCRVAVGLHLHILLGLNRLVQPPRVATDGPHAPGRLIHNHHGPITHDVLHARLEVLIRLCVCMFQGGGGGGAVKSIAKKPLPILLTADAVQH